MLEKAKENGRDSEGEAGYFPFKYHTDFIDYLADNPRLFQILTYDDLKWQGEHPAYGAYPAEYRAWNQAMRTGSLDPRKIYVLIQHDVDIRPERTLNLMRYEAARGIASNVMIFNKRVNRKKMMATGELEYMSYELDFESLRNFQAQGFVIGYHTNAYEQARYDEARAQAIFLQDVAALRRQVDIRYFSAHGGTPGPWRLNNRDLHLPAEILREFIWVDNGATPYFSLSYTDGGINSPRRNPAGRDLRDFVRRWRPGHRYRVLTHPQYYHDPCKRSPRLIGTGWYEDIWSAYHSGRGHEAWRNVTQDGDAEHELHRIIRYGVKYVAKRMYRIFDFRRKL
jgi:hypothetical protein